MAEDLARVEFSLVRNRVARAQDHGHAVHGLSARSASRVPSHVESAATTNLCPALRLLSELEFLDRMFANLRVHRLDHPISQRLHVRLWHVDRDRDICLRSVAHARKICADVFVDLGLDVSDRDDVVGTKLGHGINQVLVARGTNGLRHVAAETVFLGLVPTSGHRDSLDDS